MKKKILAAVCVICTCATSFTALFSPIASATTEGQYITYGDLYTNKPNNTFGYSEDVVFKISVTNKTSETVYGMYRYTVTKPDGTALPQITSQQQTLNSNASLTVSIPIEIQDRVCGEYKLNLEYGSGLNGRINVITQIPEATFTINPPTVNYQKLKAIDEHPGNIFYGSEPVKFSIDVVNSNDCPVYTRYSYVVTDEDGDPFTSSGQGELQMVNANSTVSHTIELTADKWKYGIYTVTLTAECAAENDPDSAMTSQVFSAQFSVCIPLGEGNANEDFGFNQKIVNSGNYPDGVTLMKNAGATWHREDVLWQGVEPIGGSNGNKYIDLGPYKAKLEEMKKRGINTVCILNGRNSLYCDKIQKYIDGELVEVTKMPSSDEAIAAYAEFCAYVAGELHGVVDHYEIYNEWNNQNFNPSQETPETYEKVLEAAYTAIKNVDQNITVIGCDTMGMPREWIGSVLQEGGGAYMDAISVHCYDYTAEDGFPEQTFKAKVEGLKAFLTERGFNKPIWLTEIGFSTYEGGRTQDEQLNAMVMLGAVNKAYGLVDKILLYALNDRFDDYGNTDPQKEEHNWGVLYNYKNAVPKNGAKKAYLGLAAINYFIGGNAEYVNKTEDVPNRQYAFEFYNRNLNKRVTLAMCGGIAQKAEMTLNIPSKSIDIYDKYGNYVYSKPSENGEYKLDITSEPVYIVHGSAFSVTKNNVEVTGISELEGGDELNIDLAGIDTSVANQKVIVGQFGEGERFLKADSFIVNGNINEFTGSFTVADGAERIVIVYWDMDSLNSLVDCCEIK